MSYILEALKKSEQERQIGHVPDISMMQETPKRVATRLPRWLPIALIVNALIIALIIWRPWEMNATRSISTAVPAVSSPAAPSSSQPTQSESGTRSTSEPANMSDASADTASAGADLPAPVTQMPLPAPTSTFEPESDITNRISVESEPVLPPRWQDLPSDERNSLPAPRIDVHVFAREPDRRFVLINLRKYQEGDTVDGGATVEAILADGIVLSYQGRRYRVDRP